MNEESCTGGMIDKTYVTKLNHVILRNYIIISTDPCQNLSSCNHSKVIYKRKRWFSSTCRTDRKMPVLFPVSLQDGAEAKRRYQRREKGKEASHLSNKECSGKLHTTLETKNCKKEGTPEAEGKHCLKGEKQTKNNKKKGTPAAEGKHCLKGEKQTIIPKKKATPEAEGKHCLKGEKKTKNRKRKGTSEAEGKHCLKAEKQTKSHKSKGTPEAEGKAPITATDNGLQEGTTCIINGRTRKDILDISGKEDGKVAVVPASLNAPVLGHSGKKLLVLDLNGLLVDIRQENNVGKKSDFRVNGKPAFKRPFCDDFLRFCFENFKIGIWSSRKRQYIAKVVDMIMSDFKHEILFCWDQSKCTATGRRALENVHKQLCFKDLRNIWDKTEPNLPFEKGEYSPINTLLIDDSPYKAFCNPPHTAIFPVPYTLEDAEDNALGPGGKLRCYLEGLIEADDVQCYVRDHPFGQPAISNGHHLWGFYSAILQDLEKKTELVPF